MTATFADLFCGAGGSCTGMVDAGFELVVGANHNSRSIETVSTNHRDAEFLCTDINHYDMRRLPHTDVLWASVICTELSPSGGRKKHRGQGRFDLEEFGHVPNDTYERTRACALDVVRATEIHRYQAVIVENVVEFARDWELYDWWVEGMCQIRPGYNVQVANVSAAHVYGEGNPPAPQWRDRIFIVFTRKGIPLPDLDLRPPSWCETCEQVVEGVQRWKREGRRVGKYGPTGQYVYRCPADSSVIEPFVLPAIAAIDLDDVGERIGDRVKPLAANTMARIEWGLREFAEPVVATVAGNTYEAPGSGYHRAWPAAGAPLNTRLATQTDALACPPLIVNTNHDDARVAPADRGLLSTRTVRIGDGVATPFVVAGYSGGIERRVAPVTESPLGTVVANGRGHHQLVVPFVTMLRANNRPTAIDEPLATVATGRHHYLTTPPGAVTADERHALVIPYRRTSRPRPVTEPLHAVSTHHSAALLHPSIAVEDCFYRMFKPREHARAQRFADSYVITGNVGEQTAQAGNAVPVNVARWVGQQLLAVLA